MFAKMLSLLVDILSSFLGEPRRHNDDSGQVAFDCPACSWEKGMPQGDGKGNLEINYEKGVFRCWSCFETNHMHGPVAKLLDKYASEKNIRDYKLIRPDDFKVKDKEGKEIIITLPEGYKKLSNCTSKDYKYDAAMLYLKERGITAEIIQEYNIGYVVTGELYNRVIIPSYDATGKLNYYVARWFDKKYNKLKYINPEAEKMSIIFNEGKVNWDATIYLVEGATDHIVTPNSIPLLGKVLFEKLLVMLHDNAMAYIVIFLDEDAYKDAMALYKQLNIGNLRGRIRIAVPPRNEDPSSIFQKWGATGIANVLMGAKKLTEQEAY